MTIINGYRYRGIKRYNDQYGKTRYYLRINGIALPDPAGGFRQFDQAYWAAVGGQGQPQAVKARAQLTRDGTIEKAVLDYISSKTFGKLAEATQVTRGGLLRAWAKTDNWKVGHALVSTLRPEDIERGLQSRKAKPKSANKWLIAVRMLLDYCIETKQYGIKKNPTVDIKRLEIEDKGGWPDWKESDIPAFEAIYQKGTTQYLGKELLLALGQRRSDVIRFGWHMVTADNMIEFTQQKTNAKMRLPIPRSLLEVLPPRNNIVGLDGKADETPFLLTVTGKHFSGARFSRFIHEAWVAAGRPHLSTHGARKLAARRLRKKHVPLALIMAFTGHATEKQLRVYLGEVEREEMAEELRAWL